MKPGPTVVIFLRSLPSVAAISFIFASAAMAAPPTPSFVARYDYSQCVSNYASLAVADTNGDWIPDVVCSGEITLTVLFGNGDGTFRSGPSSNVNGGNPIAVDVNGDGKVDTVSIGEVGIDPEQFGLLVALGNGDGTFQPPGVFYPTGGYGFIVHGDFNGDGIVDLATIGGGGIWILFGQGGGLFSQATLVPVSGGGGIDLFAIDVNGDGKLDFVASAASGFAVLLGNGDGTFQPEIDTAVPFSLTAFAVGDLNGDGKPDVFAGSVYYGDGLLYLGNGDGTFTLTRQIPINSAPESLAIADVNNDGFLDVISSGSDIVFGNGKGYFSAPVYYPIASNGDATYVLPADLRNNGRIDLLFSNLYSGFSVLLNEGKGKFQEGESVPVSGGAAYCAVSADFNGDGKPDLAVVVDSGISILLGTGKASSPYTQGQVLSYPTFSCPVEGDLNGDGIPDLLVTSGNNTAIAFIGNGDGTFTQSVKTTPLSSNGTLVVGDFNGDGKLDFALNSNLLAYGNGDGTFQTPAPYIPQVLTDDIVGIAAGRLNGDNAADIVLTDFFSGLVYVLLSNGKGFTQTTFTASGCVGPAIPVLGDVNADGHKDLLLNCDGPKVPIYLNNGAGAFSYSGVTLVTGVDGGVPIVADINGDGIADVIVQSGNDLTMNLGEGSLMFAPSVTIGTGSSPGFALAVDAHGQKFGSGKPDLIVPDGSGVVNVYLNTTK